MEHRHESKPLGTYSLLTATFNAAVWTMSGLLGKRRRASLVDILLLGVATQEVSRITTKERVTEAVRSPFVDKTPGGQELPKSEGPRRALGELLTCPYCTGSWVALGLTGLFLVAPNATRAFCTVMTVGAVSNLLTRTSAIAEPKREEVDERAAEARANA